MVSIFLFNTEAFKRYFLTSYKTECKKRLESTRNLKESVGDKEEKERWDFSKHSLLIKQLDLGMRRGGGASCKVLNLLSERRKSEKGANKICFFPP